jgi:ribosomal protein S18 acetylase RimI-like enzyme
MRLVEIADLHDALLLPWLELYETAFPPAERVLVAELLEAVTRRASDDAEAERLVALLDDRDAFVGLMQYQIVERAAAVLWYFAILPDARNRGLGAAAYHALLAELDREPVQALLFEVEIPELAHGPEERRLAERRIGFYRRLGARLMVGIQHIQRVGEHQAPIPMHVMVHPRATLDAQAAFEVAKAVFADSVAQVGPLTLE